MEHISTKDAVDYIIITAPDTVKASVTCHHLLYNRNDLLVGGIKPHLYCLPILKEQSHCIELCKAITNGTSNNFFLKFLINMMLYNILKFFLQRMVPSIIISHYQPVR